MSRPQPPVFDIAFSEAIGRVLGQLVKTAALHDAQTVGEQLVELENELKKQGKGDAARRRIERTLKSQAREQFKNGRTRADQTRWEMDEYRKFLSGKRKTRPTSAEAFNAVGKGFGGFGGGGQRSSHRSSRGGAGGGWSGGWSGGSRAGGSQAGGGSRAGGSRAGGGSQAGGSRAGGSRAGGSRAGGSRAGGGWSGARQGGDWRTEWEDLRKKWAREDAAWKARQRKWAEDAAARNKEAYKRARDARYRAYQRSSYTTPRYYRTSTGAGTRLALYGGALGAYVGLLGLAHWLEAREKKQAAKRRRAAQKKKATYKTSPKYKRRWRDPKTGKYRYEYAA